MRNQIEINIHAFAHTGIFESVGESFAIGFIGQFCSNIREIALVICILNMGQKMTALANEIKSSAQDIAGGSHFGRIDIRLRNHAAAQQDGNLMSIDAIVFGFASMDGFHIESVSEDKGDVFTGAKIGEPVPGEETFNADDDVAAKWLDG